MTDEQVAYDAESLLLEKALADNAEVDVLMHHFARLAALRRKIITARRDALLAEWAAKEAAYRNSTPQ